MRVVRVGSFVSHSLFAARFVMLAGWLAEWMLVVVSCGGMSGSRIIISCDGSSD